jgi:DNA-directed RNA polymerase subunit RPC12/RpoP
MKFDIFGRKKFKCNTCGDKFKTESELDQHRRQYHK